MDNQLFPVPQAWAKKAWCDEAGYHRLYEHSIADPEGFWGEHGKRLDWFKPYSKVKDCSFTGKVHIRWFHDGTLNAAHNCLDRHLKTRGEQTAILWEGDDPKEQRHVSYRELHAETSRLANVMKGLGVKKGDRVTIYMPMIPAAPSTSPTPSCSIGSAISPTCSNGTASRRAIASPSTCR